MKVYELESFPAVVDFVGRIAELAEAANHHPDLDIRYRKLRVALSTHDSGGLTVADLVARGRDRGRRVDPRRRRCVPSWSCASH